MRGRSPRNRLMWLETGSTYLRAGRAADAEAILDEGFARFGDDRRERMFGENALWYYKRGAARVALGRASDAVSDLKRALGVDGRKWVHGRAHRELFAASRSNAKLESLRVLAYDPRAHKLVRVSIPFWLIRLAPGKHFSFFSDNGIDFDSDRIRLTADDLERLGPSLIIDQDDRHGAHVLVWTE